MDFPWIGIGFVWLRVQKSASRSGHSAGVEYLSRLNTLAGFFGQGIFGENRHPIKRTVTKQFSGRGWVGR